MVHTDSQSPAIRVSRPWSVTSAMRLSRQLQWTGLGLLLLSVIGLAAWSFGGAGERTRILDQLLIPGPAQAKLMRRYGLDPGITWVFDSRHLAVFRDAGVPGLRRLLSEMRLPESRWARRRAQWLLWAEAKTGRKLFPLLSTQMPETRAAFAIAILRAWCDEWPGLPQGALPLLEEELSVAPWPRKPDRFLSPSAPDRFRGERITRLISAMGSCGQPGAHALVTILNSHPYANARRDALSAMGEVLSRAVKSRERERAQVGVFVPALRLYLSSEDSGFHTNARYWLRQFESFEKGDLESLPPPQGSHPGPFLAPPH